ncbi:MAG: aldose 1-epimerase [Rhodothermaceae bacterium]
MKNKINGEYITVLPQLGARLNEVVLLKNKTSYSVISKLESEDFEVRDNQFNNAKLFPFANRLQAGEYTFEGKIYNLAKNYPEENNACHGFVYNRPFEYEGAVLSENCGELKFSYQYYGDDNGYPFPFKLFVSYKLLSDGRVDCETKVRNLSDSKLPFSDGWHHYFTLGKSIDELTMEMEVNKYKLLNNNGIPEREVSLDKNESRFELKNKFFDTIFVAKDQPKIVTKLMSEDICLNICQESISGSYKYLNVYTPPHRNSIAIEPMTSNINAFNNKEGLVMLEPEEEWVSVMGIFLN